MQSAAPSVVLSHGDLLLLVLLQGVLGLLADLHPVVLGVFLSPAEGVEHVEERHRDVDEYDQGEERVRDERVWTFFVANEVRRLSLLLRLELKYFQFMEISFLLHQY